MAIDLKKFQLFSTLPQNIIQNLFKEHRLLKLKRGDYLYHSGDEVKNLFLIEKGLVGLISITPKGGEHLLRLYKSGQMFGHRALFADERYFGSSQALEPSDIIVIPSFCINRLIDIYPKLAKVFLQLLSQELRLAEQQRVMISESDVEARVAGALLYIKQVDSERNWTRKEIADFCGSTGPTVIKVIIKFGEMGLIRFHGRKIEILHKDRLLKLTQFTSKDF
ncbi:MAG TPA: Crp/Fnr family transcriptional regulator [Pseudobdellovibrionaceae bacterium]|nr:Crp/Fnr family transcriptional regulator [Pseudobdellovibrionaceae bacterium]